MSTATEITIKKLTADNQTEIEALFATASDYALLESGKSDPKNEALSVLTDLPEGKAAADKEVFGIYSSTNKLVGIIDLVKDFPTTGEWMLGLLEFVPEARGNGLGHRVHEQLVEQVKSSGGTSLRIGVLADNPRAEKFWLSLGYQIFKTTELTFGEKTHQVKVMRLKFQ